MKKIIRILTVALAVLSLAQGISSEAQTSFTDPPPPTCTTRVCPEE
jgi:hypothetical protein